MQVCVLGSSSSGNAIYIECDSIKILVDAGLRARIIQERLREIDVEVDEIDAIFITHEHSDHIAALKTLTKQQDIPVYCTRCTAEAIENTFKKSFNFHIFSTAERFIFGPFEIEAFSVFHDAQDPVGFTFTSADGRLGIISDLGYITPALNQKLNDCNIIIIESNHEEKLLVADIRRPWTLKQRILSRQGHLSNDAACRFICDIAKETLQHVVLFHLSQDCNKPDIAYNKMRNALDNHGFTHTTVHMSHPNKISFKIVLEELQEVSTIEQKQHCFEQLEIPMGI